VRSEPIVFLSPVLDFGLAWAGGLIEVGGLRKFMILNKREKVRKENTLAKRRQLNYHKRRYPQLKK
jgi:hypothetical protein